MLSITLVLMHKYEIECHASAFGDKRDRTSVVIRVHVKRQTVVTGLSGFLRGAWMVDWMLP